MAKENPSSNPAANSNVPRKDPPRRGNDLNFTDPGDFERYIGLCYQNAGYELTMPPANTRGYDLELRKNGEIIAVQAKLHRVPCNVANVQKFRDFLESDRGQRFDSGWMISQSGFSPAALALVESDRLENLCLGTLSHGKFTWNYPRADSAGATGEEGGEPGANSPIRYIGVFTGKGGVGKTTVAAHLAGAFALMGYDVIVLDLDPDRNLRKLFLRDRNNPQGDASLYVPPRRRGLEGATITVLPYDQWHPEDHHEARLVICDCSPVMRENPTEMIARFDHVIIPTTLNPLGISKNSDVIVRTFAHLRSMNDHAQMFVLLNNHYDADRKRNNVLFQMLKRDLAPILHNDPLCHLISPQAVRIRYSTSLYYWGYHMVEGTLPELAFQEFGGRSHPREDFLQLADYIQNHTDIEQMLREEGEEFG